RRRIANANQPWREMIDVLRSNGTFGENPRSAWRDPMVRRNAGYARARTLADLEMVSARLGIRGHRTGLAAAERQRDQHGMDAGSCVPGFLHAGWLCHAGVGIRALA